MEFLGQSVQKLEPEQTDRRNWKRCHKDNCH